MLMGINRRGLFPQGFGNQKGAIHLFLPVVILGVAAVIVSTNIQTTTRYSNQVQGIFIAKQTNGGNSESNRLDNPGNSNSSGNQGRSEEAKLKQETRTNNEPTKTDIKEDQIRTKTFQGTTNIRVQQKKNESLTETETEDEEASGSSDQGGTLQELRSISKFPLRIDLATNQLIMTKNGVERVLTVLPAKAVQNMLRAHLKKGLGPKFFEGATPSATPIATSSASPSPASSATPSASPTEEPVASESAEITVSAGQITLEESDGQFVYKIPAKKHLKLFGFIPVTTNFTGFVSAETGALIKEQQSLLSRILDLLSP